MKERIMGETIRATLERMGTRWERAKRAESERGISYNVKTA